MRNDFEGATYLTGYHVHPYLRPGEYLLFLENQIFTIDHNNVEGDVFLTKKSGAKPITKHLN